MTENPQKSDDDWLEFLDRALRSQEGTLDAAGLERLSAEIKGDEARRNEFIQLQLRSALIHEVLQRESYDPPEMTDDVDACSAETNTRAIYSTGWSQFWPTIAVCSLSLVMVLTLLNVREPGQVPVAVVPEVELSPSIAKMAMLVESSHASFFGNAMLTPGNPLTPLQDYMLKSGLVKIEFPSGATAIIEAPAMFHVADAETLSLTTGLCSVHAPPGAEGFRVLTPVTKIIDRGTRFSVKVHENSETEVQVIEGVADLYSTARIEREFATGTVPAPATPLEGGMRLQHGQAMRVGTYESDTHEVTPFDEESYRRQLPDRIVRYETGLSADGEEDELMNVTVQRQGQLQTYAADELIPIEVTWFHGDGRIDSTGHLLGGTVRPQRPQDWLEDRRLSTGIINFGGQPEPLSGEPVMTSSDSDSGTGTPGLGIRFRTPVTNSPGPDVILFEVQCFTNPMDGDPFHVIPVQLRPGLKPLTIRKFDLTMNSPESKEICPFWLHRYPKPIDSLAELAVSESNVIIRSALLHFRAIAVGIDLSDLGYRPGEQVEELFFQHGAAGTASKVDPVFIAGLPALPPGR